MKQNPLEFIKRFIQFLKHHDALIDVCVVIRLDMSLYRIYIITNLKSYEFFLYTWSKDLEVGWTFYKSVGYLSESFRRRFFSIEYAKPSPVIKYLKFDYIPTCEVNISEAIGATVVAPSDFQSTDT